MKLRFTWAASTVAAVILLAPMSAPFASEAGGFFRFGDERAEFSHGVAIRWDDPDNPGSKKLGVVLSAEPLDAASAQGNMRPLDALTGQLSYGDPYLQLSLDEEGAGFTISHLFVSPGGFNTSGNGDERIAIEGGRVKGSWKLAPKEFFDKTYEADFRFDVALVELKDPGQPLPAGGGEPGKAYSAYIEALAKGDVERVKAALTESRGWMFAWADDEKEIAKALESEALHKPVKVTVLGGWIDGERAQIKVEGPGRLGGVYAGRVMMVRDGGRWKVDEQNLD
jgi:hypothetical protein